MPGKYYEYLKCGSYVVPVEISFLTSKIITNAKEINTSKWIERHHWKEIKHLLKPALQACTNTDVFSKSPHIVFGNEVGLGYLIVSDREKFPFLAVLEPKNHCWTDDEEEDEEDLDQAEASIGSLWHQSGTLTNYPPTKVYIKAAVTKRSYSSVDDKNKLEKELGFRSEANIRTYLESSAHQSSSSSSSKDKFKRQRNKSGSSGFGDDNPLRNNLYLNMPKGGKRGRGKPAFGGRYSDDEDSEGYVELDLLHHNSSSSDDDDDNSLPDIPEVDVSQINSRPPVFPLRPVPIQPTAPSSPTKQTAFPPLNGLTTIGSNGRTKLTKGKTKSQPGLILSLNGYNEPPIPGTRSRPRAKQKGAIDDLGTSGTSRRSTSKSPTRDYTKKSSATTKTNQRGSPDITQIKSKTAPKPTKKIPPLKLNDPGTGELRELQINEQSNSPLKNLPQKETQSLHVEKSTSISLAKEKPRTTPTVENTKKKKINGPKNPGTPRKATLRLRPAKDKPLTTENVPVEINQNGEKETVAGTSAKRRKLLNTATEKVNETATKSQKQVNGKESSNTQPHVQPEFNLRKIKQEKDAPPKILESESESQPNDKDPNSDEDDYLEMPKLTPQVPFVSEMDQDQVESNSSKAKDLSKRPTKLERLSPPVDVGFNKGKKKKRVVHNKSTSTTVSTSDFVKTNQQANKTQVTAASTKPPLISESGKEKDIPSKETQGQGGSGTASEKEDIFSFTHITKNPVQQNDSDIFSAVALMPPPSRPAPRTPRKFTSRNTALVPSTLESSRIVVSNLRENVLDRPGALSHLSTFEILTNPNVLSTGMGLLQKMAAKNPDSIGIGKKLGVLPNSPERPKRAISPDITALPTKKSRKVVPSKSGKGGSLEDSQSEDEMDVYEENPEGERLIRELLNRFDTTEEEGDEYEPLGDEHDLSQRSLCCVRVFPGYPEKSRLFKIHCKKIQEMPFEQLMGYYFELKPTLRNIFEGQEPSIRNRVYLEGTKSRSKLREMNVSIPFDNDQSSTLLQSLFDFFVPDARDRPQWTDYINYVLLPETMVRIFAKVNDVPMLQAENEMRFGGCY